MPALGSRIHTLSSVSWRADPQRLQTGFPQGCWPRLQDLISLVWVGCLSKQLWLPCGQGLRTPGQPHPHSAMEKLTLQWRNKREETRPRSPCMWGSGSLRSEAQTPDFSIVGFQLTASVHPPCRQPPPVPMWAGEPRQTGAGKLEQHAAR